MNEEIPGVDVIRHWVSWGPSENCPDEFIDFDKKRETLFDLWLSFLKKESYLEGWNDRALLDERKLENDNIS
jgi:hypothetical protein